MPYLIALALIIAVAIYLCARLFPRTHATPTRGAGPEHTPRDPAERRAAEGEPS